MAVGNAGAGLQSALANTMVEAKRSRESGGNAEGKALIPLSALVSTSESLDFREIRAGKNGEYLPVAYDGTSDPETTAEAVKEAVAEVYDWDAELTGAFFSDSEMMKEMAIILLVSVILMYFILCAQFESFLQPLIVLLEIPIDTAFALIVLGRRDSRSISCRPSESSSRVESSSTTPSSSSTPSIPSAKRGCPSCAPYTPLEANDASRHHHDLPDHHNSDAADALHQRPREPAAASARRSHDRLDGAGDVGQHFHNSFGLLYYLQTT